MIIESAFLKLPELLLGHSSPRKQYEYTLTSHFAMGILLELSARNIELPMHRIHIERPYPEIRTSKIPGRSDLYVDLDGIFRGLGHEYYGMKPDNWIEVKFFGGIGRSVGTQTKTTNAAKIALDLFRLCLYVQELRSRHRNNARYFLVVFNRHPSKYLALQRLSSDYPEREWLHLLLKSGEKNIDVSLEQEPNAFRKIFPLKNPQLDLKLRVVTREFSPIETPNGPYEYWGYLVRVVDFELSYGDKDLIYKDTSQDSWTEEQEETQKFLIEKTLE